MALANRIAENRSTVVLVVLVVVSLASLASGKQAAPIGAGVRKMVGVAAYPFHVASRNARRTVDHVSGLIVSYNAAQEENDTLYRRLATLTQHVSDKSEFRAENDRLRRMLNFQRHEYRLTLEPVEVIRRSKGTQTLTIRGGQRAGVEELMCVMTPDGVVGVVTEVGLFESTVATLHHADCRIGTVTRRNRTQGVVRGSGGDRNYICSMEYIDIKDDVRPGDVVVTDGVGLFPGGCSIGTVSEVRDRGSLFKTAYIEPAADPYRVEELFLVRRAESPTEELAGPALEHSGVSLGHPLPDDRSLQERYAP